MGGEDRLAVTSSVVRSPGPMSGCIDAHAILMSVESGKYYSLNPMGTRIWERIESPLRIDALIQALLDEFDVDPAVCEAEVLQFLSCLRREHLLEVQC